MIYLLLLQKKDIECVLSRDWRAALQINTLKVSWSLQRSSGSEAGILVLVLALVLTSDLNESFLKHIDACVFELRFSRSRSKLCVLRYKA